MIIKRLELADLDEVMEIEPVAFGSHHWSHQSFVNELENQNGHYYALRDSQSNKLLGYTGFWLIQDEAHITTLAIHPDHRRLHLGETLLIHDIQSAQSLGARWMTLEVRVSNESAKQLYYKYSFKSLGTRKQYYQDNQEDALVLWTESIDSKEFNELLQTRIEELSKLSSIC